MAVKKLPASLREYFDFRIYDDCIEFAGLQVFFLRVHPKNMSILSYGEKLSEIKNFQKFLDASAAHFSVFVTDKTESLEDISRFYKRQMNLRPEYEFIFKPIIDSISSIEDTSASVRRAFYIVFHARERREYEIFARQLAGGLDCVPVKKDELVLLLRNYILREYTPFSLYVFEDALKRRREEENSKARRNRKAKANPLREEREDNLAALDRLSAAAKPEAVPEETPEEKEESTRDVKTEKADNGEPTGGLWPHA
jgi:hypothetical protein